MCCVSSFFFIPSLCSSLFVLELPFLYVFVSSFCFALKPLLHHNLWHWLCLQKEEKKRCKNWMNWLRTSFSKRCTPENKESWLPLRWTIAELVNSQQEIALVWTKGYNWVNYFMFVESTQYLNVIDKCTWNLPNKKMFCIVKVYLNK